MRPFFPLLISVVVFFSIFSAVHYTANTNYQRGYLAAEAQGFQRINALKAEHNKALANQYQSYLAKLEQAKRQSDQAAKSHLDQQSQLNQQLQRLQGELHETLRYQPECTFTVRWVQHYQAALGLPTDDRGSATATSTANTARKNAIAANAETLLQHAEQYGHWCQSAVNKLSALQRLIETAERFSW